ncbi:hypothetical protein CAI21_04390 [Alkalilimnicola ehrlichii]|uniref:Lipoprotein n=1 Tax=Alkalilimnicola ehrlichii TaxID=351052 RepID=A0A3E0X1M3_9GAMM|nr:hypothetical protein [Alkalilimnicola ehrlichii]RFA30753.1 hypothetical protein CAI21_04390 [Alkalilimnicola ehrlichii]RFA38329.1 hypothetical protein CAL65_05755 [Alkalilimnicola ehrlichii]
MKKPILSILIGLGLVGGATGCSVAPPDCSDHEATELVLEITRDEFATVFGSRAAAEIELDLSEIETVNINAQTKARSCSALLTMSSPEATYSDTINYTIEAANKRGEFEVVVFGL